MERNNSAVPKMPIEINIENSAGQRWLKKPVLESIILDNMEGDAGWTHHLAGEMDFSSERFLDGTRSLRLISPTKEDAKVDPSDRENYGRPFNEAVCRRNFPGEDWTRYNRISFWVYPVLPGFKVISMYSKLHNEGNVPIPDSYLREGLNYFLIRPNQWNHVVWEIASLPREKVTAVEIIYRLQGNEPGAADKAIFYIDRLELQKVEADYFEGWGVAPGRISFSHTGYQAGSRKTALASGIAADEFSLLNSADGKVIITKPVQKVQSHIGEFQLLDFSEIEADGEYRLKAGNIETQPFRIDGNVWRGTIWKTINFFFCERCGFEVPGIHGICHRDWQCAHEDKRIIINGGWHDAGDLSQGVCNTAEATYAMFALAEKVKVSDPELFERLIEEAKWGLDWVLKTRFGDGYRSVWATMDFWTDGIIGTFDDITFQAFNSPFDNFVTSAAESIASRVMKDIEPDLSSYCLNAAKSDWDHAMDGLTNPKANSWRAVSSIQKQAEGALASIELFRFTGEKKYSEAASNQARYVMDCQQTEFTDWDVPLSGFFYTDTDKKSILEYPHRSHSQAPIVALAELCREFPNHPDWINWYSAIVRYSEYEKLIVSYTKPYGMPPSAIYRLDASDMPNYREQVLNGIRLSDNYYLRLFPVWFAFRGNNSLILSEAKALSSCAAVRRDQELAELCQLQLEWMVGRNPFSQSLMYGEGYDYAPQYTAMSGDMVGSLPVGIQTSVNKDIPYWPFNNCYNYKEVWVQPSARWLWLMSELSGPAKVSGHSGQANAGIKFTNEITGSTFEACLDKNGDFSTKLPAGRYTVLYSMFKKSIMVLPGETFNLDLSRFYSIRTDVKQQDNSVRVTLHVESNYPFCVELASHNLGLETKVIKIAPQNGAAVIAELSASILNSKERWILVMVPDGNRSELVEFHG